eukprot:2041736-Rhodomonas_salina.1
MEARVSLRSICVSLRCWEGGSILDLPPSHDSRVAEDDSLAVTLCVGQAQTQCEAFLVPGRASLPVPSLRPFYLPPASTAHHRQPWASQAGSRLSPAGGHGFQHDHAFSAPMPA